jgi:CRP-like cAMP-binding protein
VKPKGIHQVKKFYLGLEKGSFQKSIYPLEGSMIIGRSSENDITLVDRTVSRAHGRISFQRGAWIIEDLGSANGIIFAGQRVAKRTLHPGDAFQMGDLTFRLIEKSVLEEAGQLSETIRAFAAIIKSESFMKRYRTKPEFMHLREALLSTPIFDSLRHQKLSGLEDIANLHLFGADQLIISEGDPGRSIYIILDGRVRVFTRDYHGKEFELAVLEAKQFFGEMSLLTGEPRSSSVASLEESLLSEISYRSMRKLIFRHPQVKDVMLDYFHKRAEDSRNKRAEANMQDRRRHPRLSERLLVRFTVPPVSTLPDEMISHTYKATSSDVSPSGTRLVVMGPAMEAFCPGCQLRLEIELHKPWGKVRTLGTIRSVIPGEHTTQLNIEFLGMSEEDGKRLKDFMYGESHVTA